MIAAKHTAKISSRWQMATSGCSRGGSALARSLARSVPFESSRGCMLFDSCAWRLSVGGNIRQLLTRRQCLNGLASLDPGLPARFAILPFEVTTLHASRCQLYGE